MSSVLLIDDEEGIQSLGQRIVTRMGHRVACAGDGETATSLARAQPYDLILTDFNLPGHPTGMELMHALRQLQPTCPVVVMTGLADHTRMHELRDLGIQHLLPKPFDINQLRALVSSLLPPAT
jgi:DNA-binding NtrC family response regulator